MPHILASKSWWLAAVVFALFVYIFRGILAPFIVGVVVAYILHSLVDPLQKILKSRIISTLIVMGGFFTGIIALCVGAIPILHAQLSKFAASLPYYRVKLVNNLGPFLSSISERFPEYNLQKLQQLVGDHVGDMLGWVISLILGLISNSFALATLLAFIVIAPMVTYYILVDWHKIIAQLDSWLPRRYAPLIRQQISLIHHSLSGFLKGELLVSAFMTTYFCAALCILDLDFAIMIGLLSGLLVFIPYVYVLIGLLLSVSVACGQYESWTPIFIVIGIYIIGQMVESNLLTPKFVGHQIGLHPLWIIFALFAGASIAGLTGVIIAMPFAAIIGVITRFGLSQYLQSQEYLGSDVS